MREGSQLRHSQYRNGGNVCTLNPFRRAHLKTEDEHRRDICTVGRWIHDRGYVASTDGNISAASRPAPHSHFAHRHQQRHDDARRSRHHRSAGPQAQRPPQCQLRTRHASSDLPPPPGHQRRLPRASARGHRLRRCRHSAQQSDSVRTRALARLHSRRALRHARHSGADRRARTARSKLRRDPDGQSRRGLLRARICSPLFSAWRRPSISRAFRSSPN